MKKRDVINSFLLILLTIYIIFYKTTLITLLIKYADIITSLFLIILTFIAYLFLGYKKTKDNLKRKNINNLIIYEIIIYFFIYFGIGIFLGFQNNIYSLNIKKVLLNTSMPILIVVSSEILRNIVVQSNKDKKIVIVVFTILLSLLELVDSIDYYHIETIEGLFKMFACGLLPLLVKHSLLTYLTYYLGIKSSLIYRLIFTLYVYLTPILPNLGDYITCLIELIFPFIIFISVANINTEHEYVAINTKEKKFGVIDYIFTAVFILVVCVVGGVFNVKLIAIASNSMNPEFYRGDAVLIEKYDGKTIYKKGDIISFEYTGRNTVHRIVEIEEKDGDIYYHTKGDNNNSEDSLLVVSNNVYGKVLFKIPYIGYPSVLISEMRNRSNENS